MSNLPDILTRLRSELEEHVTRKVQAAGNTLWPEPTPVEVCLPIEHTLCLAHCGKTIGWRGCFFNNQKQFLFEGRDITANVTYWMPNPPTPKKKTE